MKLRREMDEKRIWKHYIKDRLIAELKQNDWGPVYHNYDIS